MTNEPSPASSTSLNDAQSAIPSTSRRPGSVPRKLALVGFMGTGKTTVGRIAAQRLGLVFFEVDEWIEESQGRVIAEIFRTDGEPFFRRLEEEAIAERTADPTPYLLACGGGVVLSDRNVENLRRAGPIVCLTADVRVILERTQGMSRPLLAVDDREHRILQLLEARRERYALADCTIDTSHLTPEEVAGRIEEFWRSFHR